MKSTLPDSELSRLGLCKTEDSSTKLLVIDCGQTWRRFSELEVAGSTNKKMTELYRFLLYHSVPFPSTALVSYASIESFPEKIEKSTFSLIGLPIQEPTITMFRMVGAAILGFTTSSWFAYKQTLWDRVKIVVQAEIVWTILATLTMLYGLIFVHLPVGLWMNVVIMGAFAVAFTTFYYRT